MGAATAKFCVWVALLLHSTADWASATKHNVSENSDATADEARVVAQIPMFGWVMDQRDGYALVRVEPSAFRGRQHLIELHELSGPTLVRVLEFPNEAEHAALGPEGKWCIVSLRDNRSILRVDLVRGTHEVIISGSIGVLALDEDARRLAILGHLGHRGPDTEHTGLTLGVWDLMDTKWIESVRTPIGNIHLRAIDHHLPPVWSNDMVLVEGPDARAWARRVGGSQWLTTLDLSTGESETVERPPNRGRNDEWMSPRTAAQARARAQWEPRLRERWEGIAEPNRRVNRPPDLIMSMVESRSGELVIAMHQHRGPVWTIHLDRDGEFRIGDFDDAQRYRDAPNATAGRLITIRRDSIDSREVYDFVERQTIATLPLSPGRHEGGLFPIHQYLPQGWIEVDRERLCYYEPGHDGERWAIQLPMPSEVRIVQLRSSLRVASGSPDGRSVTVPNFGDPRLLEVRHGATGEVLAAIQIPAEHTFPTATAFSIDGDVLAVAFDDNIHLYATSTGERLATEPLAPRSNPYRILPLDNGWWIVQGLNELVVLDDHLTQQLHLPIRRTLTATLVGDPIDSRIVLIGELGEVHVIDLQNGRILARWDHSLPRGGPMRRDGPFQSMVAFDGRLLARSTGHAGTIELFRLPELELVASVQRIRGDNDQPGWLIITPDGYWDASANAEQFVRLISGVKPMPLSNVENRRNSDEIRKRISSAIRGLP